MENYKKNQEENSLELSKIITLVQSMQQCHLPDQSHVPILRTSAHMGMLEQTDKINHALSPLN